MLTIREANKKVREAVLRYWSAAHHSPEGREGLEALRALTDDENIPSASRAWAAARLALAAARAAAEEAEAEEKKESEK